MSTYETNNFVYDFFIVLANVGLGVLLASFFVAYAVYLPLLNGEEEFINSSATYLSITEDEDSGDGSDDEDEDSGDGSDDEVYERKYIKELESIEDVLVTKEELDNMKKIIETTPNYGDVLMIFNSDFEYFKYYCNSKDIPHKILETVARKYCIENNCKQIYVDMYKEMYKLRKKLVTEEILKKNEKKEEPESEISLVNSVFASFKKYNNIKGRQNNVQKSKSYIKEKINVFKYCGKIEDYTIDNNKKPKNEKVLKLDFASFKRIMAESEEKIKLA